MLLRPQRLQIDRRALLQGGQTPLLLGLAVVDALLVDGKKSGDRHGRPGGAKKLVGDGRVRPGSGAARELDGDGVYRRVPHLAGDGAFPDQLVELRLIARERPGKRFRGARDGGRPDRLVRLLRIPCAGAKDARLARHVAGAERLRDVVANLRHRLGREGGRVGAHVGDETDRAITGVDTLVELLGDAHRPVRGETELSGRLLLKRGGDERRGGIASPLLLLDAVHAHGADTAELPGVARHIRRRRAIPRRALSRQPGPGPLGMRFVGDG